MPQKSQQGLLQRVKIPLFGAYSNRGLDKAVDQRFFNCFPESRKVEQTDQTRVALVKRPGVNFYKKFEATGSEDPDNVARGLIYFNGGFVAVVDDQVLIDHPFGGTGVPWPIINMSTSSGKVGMVLGNSAIFGDYLFICDGIDGWFIDTSFVANQVIDPDFPTPHIPTPVFLDGYICLAKGSDIFSCDLDTPSSWNASNFVSAESFSDPIVGLARQNNQIVAFGSSSTEFFYDAANSSGSPFNRNESAIIQVGCAASHCIYQNERYCAFIGQSGSGGRAVWFIDGFQPKKVSDEFIDRIIDSEPDLFNCSGFGVRTKGHMFYIINLKHIERTLVYDVDEKLWHEWSTYHPTLFDDVFNFDHAADPGDGYTYLQCSDTPFVGFLDPQYYRDTADETGASNKILVYIRTNPVDMDTLNRKRLHSLRLFAQRDMSITTSDKVDLYFSDNDYQVDQGPYEIRLMAPSLDDLDYPIINQLGTFRRRSFYLEYESDSDIRFEAIELCYTEGVS